MAADSIGNLCWLWREPIEALQLGELREPRASDALQSQTVKRRSISCDADMRRSCIMHGSSPCTIMLCQLRLWHPVVAET
eukprot:COSAG05_NODE_17773_length_319_cov_0.940909_1_plen_79_part_01